MENNQKVILVTGATGQQGGAAIRHLLKDGWKIRALTRDTSKPQAEELKKLGVEVVQGDMNDKPSLEKALEGVYGVFSVQNFWEHGFEGERTQGLNLIDAAKAAGVKHFLMTSVGGAERKTGLPHFDVKAELEDHLKKTGMEYTIIRPVFFMENFSTWFKPSEEDGKLNIAMAMKENTKLQMIAVDDIGAFARKIFSEPEKFKGKEIEIAGEEITMPEVASIYEEVFSKKAEFKELPVEVVRENSKEVADMFQWFMDKGYEANISELRQMIPGLKSFKEWLIASKN